MIIDALISQLRNAANYNPKVQVAPAAILWTDTEKQWQSAMPYIKQQIPELIELGEYQPETRTGPAIWVKCAIAGVADDCELPKDKTPIIYLPGVSRKDLRAIEQCPDELKPLAELQYRGCWWAYNTAGRDWSVSSFLTNPKVGLALDVAKDKATQAAIIEILPDLLQTPVEMLKGSKLEANDFYSVVMDDPIKDVLSWLDNPEEKQASWQASKHAVFVNTCEGRYGFTPTVGDLSVPLQSLCAADGEWDAIWQRFEGSAKHLQGIVAKLEAIEPLDLAADASKYLSENVNDERGLASALAKVALMEKEQASTELHTLFSQHKDRLGWLWSELDLSPWLDILSELNNVAIHTEKAFSAGSVQDMADVYQEKYWQADASALAAMAASKDIHQQEVVANILACIYTPWLEEVAINFQNLVRNAGYPGHNQVNENTAEYRVSSQLIFFVDGLRFDTAKMLQAKLQAVGINVDLNTKWSAVPSLTATAKAAVTPVNHLLSGSVDNVNFIPELTQSGSEFSSYHFKKQLSEAGWQYLDGLDTGDASGYAWVQTGDLDHMGHEQQRKMPLFIEQVLDEVVSRIVSLQQSGWQHIKVVTDHGWLWVPNKLQTANIDKNLTQKRLARCAILKAPTVAGLVTLPWHWNPAVSIAMAPGIAGFVAGDYYNHGGLSLQECLTPVLSIKSS